MTIDKRKTLWIALAVVAAILLGFGAKALFFPAKKDSALVTATATRGDLEQTVLATGSLEPSELVSVGAQVSGQVTKLNVALGDTVKKGDPIASIDSANQTNALRTAQAALANVRAQRAETQANLAQTRATYERQKTLLAADATARADYEAAEAAYKASQAQLQSIDAQIAQASVSVETAGVNLGYTRIVAPMDGTVVAIVTKEGQTVNANQTAPTIIKLAKLDTMTIKAQISEADVINVKPGQDVYFTILGDPQKKYRAKLRAIEPAPVAITDSDSIISSSTSTTTAIYYNGLFDVPNEDGRLRTFMTAQVSIVQAQARNAVMIPSQALGRKSRDGGYVVQVVGPKDKIERRKVKIGINNGSNVQIVSGLNEGEKVVLSSGAAKPSGAGGGGGRRRGPAGPFG